MQFSFEWTWTESVFSLQMGKLKNNFLSPQLPILYILKYLNVKYNGKKIYIWLKKLSRSAITSKQIPPI